MKHECTIKPCPLCNDGGDALTPAALPPVRSEPLLASGDAMSAAILDHINAACAVDHDRWVETCDALRVARDQWIAANNNLRLTEPAAGEG